MNKLLTLTPLIIILLLSSLPFATATVTLYASNPAASYDSIYVQQNDNDAAVGFAISGNNEYLHSVSFYLENDSVTEGGTIYATLLTALAGNGTRAENSTQNFDLSTLAEDDWVTFNFSSTTLLSSGSTYYIGLVNNGSLVSSFRVLSDTHGDGPYKVNIGSAWFATGSGVLPCYYVYTDDGVSPTSTPGIGGTSTTEEVINTFTNYLIPLILFLLPALILGWITHWQKWPILIGLAIGSGLTYLFLGANYLWLVVLVIIGVGAAAYQSTRGWG